MIQFFAGFFIGEFAGIMIMCLLIASKDKKEN